MRSFLKTVGIDHDELCDLYRVLSSYRAFVCYPLLIPKKDEIIELLKIIDNDKLKREVFERYIQVVIDNLDQQEFD
jgi:hypothetical protein